MPQHHSQNLQLSVGVKQTQSYEFQKPLHTQCHIMFPEMENDSAEGRDRH